MRLLLKLHDFLLAMLAVVLADVVLFHLGAYFPLVQPESYSGQVERQARRFAGMIEDSPGRNRIVIMGNSITVNSIQERQLEVDLAERGLRYEAVNIAIGGSAPRAWSLLLDNGPVTRNNTEIVILGLNPSAIQASTNNARALDMEISKTCLKIGDAFWTASSYQHVEMRLMVFSSVVFRTLLFRNDVKQLLKDPWKRRRQLAARARDEHGGAVERRENRSRNDLLSARLGSDGKIVFDQLAKFLKKKDRLRAGIERRLVLRDELLARGEGPRWSIKIDPARLAMVGRLVERLNGRGIKVVFSVAPRSPYPLAALDASQIKQLYQQLARQGADVALWHDPALIRRLEAPEYYKALVHVNAAGAEIYTAGLARFLAQELNQ